MSFKTTKLKWAKKLLSAKMFVVMTDKESAIAIDGADPYSFTDALALAAQSAELELFYDSLGKLIKDHNDALAKLGGLDVQVKETATTSRKTNAAKSAKSRSESRRLQTVVRAGTAKKAKSTKK